MVRTRPVSRRLGRLVSGVAGVVLVLGSCGGGTEVASTSPTDISTTSDPGILIEIVEGADDKQDGYEGCYEYPTPCGATLVETATVPEDEFSDTENPRDFSENVVTVSVGDTVSWRNDDGVIHTVTAVDGTFDSGDMFRNDEFSFSFDQPGEYEVFCKPHPWMRAKVVVEG